MATIFPSGPKGHWIFGNMKQMQEDPLSFWMHIAKEYGDFVHVRSIRKEGIYFINDADALQKVLVTDNKHFTKSLGLERTKRLLGEGLLTSEGDMHRKQRRLVMPAFHRRRIQDYGIIMSEYTDEHMRSWNDGAIVDIAEEWMQLTLKIVGRTLFDADVSKEARAVGEMINTLMDGWSLSMLLPNFIFELLLKLPLPKLQKLNRAIDDMDSLIYRIIQERRASGEDRGDLLSMLLKSVDEEDGAQMTDQQARDEAMTLFLAGHETTANALTWTWYVLTQHPEIEQKLQEEVDRVLQGRLPTMDDLKDLTYTDMIFREAMRLYPPAWAIGRKTIDDYEVNGFHIPAESPVLCFPYVIHRDPRHYPEPEAFIPERWTTEERAKRHKYAYIPFGGGPRRCAGEAFAMMEGVLLLASTAQKWSMELVEEQVIEMKPQITLRPKNGIKMRLRLREVHAKEG